MLPISLEIISIITVLIGIIVNGYILLIVTFTKQVLIGLGCGWIVSILFGFPQLLRVAPYHYDARYEYCLPDFRTTGSLVYSTSLTAFTIFLPIILIFGCNMKVLMIARYQRHRIASAILEVTLSAQLTITHQRNPFFIPSFTSAIQNPAGLKIHAHSPVSNIFQLVGSIIFIYCPFYICNLWNNIIEAVSGNRALSGGEKQNVETDLSIPKIVLQTSATLLLLSPFVNALLYGIKNKIIRKSFHNFWRKQKSKIEIHYEIQARTPSTCGSRRPSINGAGSAQPLLHRQLSETFLEISKADINNIQSDIKLRSESLWSSNSKLSSYSVLNSPTGNVTTSNLTPGPLNSAEPKFVYLNPTPSTSSATPSTSPQPPPSSPVSSSSSGIPGPHADTPAPPIAHCSSTNSNNTSSSGSSGPSKIACNIKSAVRHYSSHSTKPKIKITKTFSEEKQPSPKHTGIKHPLDDMARPKAGPSNTKSLFNLGLLVDDNLLMESSSGVVHHQRAAADKKADDIPIPLAPQRTINSSPFKKYSSLQEISITSTTATICDILK
ncbi:uncharacterized protein LOC129740438 isoform X2 [Uranotaenia lowii]|uniref:uncharacterized protein LOC129740438 isoform X2 n=1 Tax=Uranotaenia lowii TaxID=190385 RepID=UPI0024795808|nr:uncharacterized protein LOC129740438 isoform X2 [Uranotaenia lowii]